MTSEERAYEAHQLREDDLPSEVDAIDCRLDMANFTSAQNRAMRELPELAAAKEALRALRAAANKAARAARKEWEREGDRLYAVAEAAAERAGYAMC